MYKINTTTQKHKTPLSIYLRTTYNIKTSTLTIEQEYQHTEAQTAVISINIKKNTKSQNKFTTQKLQTQQNITQTKQTEQLNTTQIKTIKTTTTLNVHKTPIYHKPKLQTLHKYLLVMRTHNT